MTWERKTVIKDPGIPDGYKVTFHEIRGYDSPDRWYETRYKGRKFGNDLGSLPEAVSACRQHADKS